MLRASRVYVERMKVDMESHRKCMDSMDVTLNTILEKSTTAGVTTRTTASKKGGMVPTFAAGTNEEV
jgi:hypothetical protein